MLGNELRERNEDPNLERHLAMVGEAISVTDVALSNAKGEKENKCSQEFGFAEHKKLQPVEAEGNDIGDSDRHNHKLECLNRTPQPLQIS